MRPGVTGIVAPGRAFLRCSRIRGSWIRKNPVRWVAAGFLRNQLRKG
jgi:hypothetical protein